MNLNDQELAVDTLSRDEYYMVAAGNSLALNQGIQEEQVVPARYRQEFLTIAWEQIIFSSYKINMDI
ncbi:hypothetical protein RJ640_012569 [Escallonia rubra]|uniref:Uncharacterized protein n=1 Tax=Escallonia rubra TaxID=112253 RepID=A0AA88QS50_9ASTE|nr:hypothetical protein RJ640_012569 [Escallonia rubra]